MELNPTIKTSTGLYFDFVNTSVELVNLKDITHALSNICRFGGHCRRFYSVAQHLIECVRFAREYTKASKNDLRDIFCHDFTEAYVGDMCKPLKNLLPEYSVIESRIEKLIEEKFKVNLSNPLIKEVDLTLLFAERDVLFEPDDYTWNEYSDKYNYKPDWTFMDVGTVRKIFVKTAEELDI